MLKFGFTQEEASHWKDEPHLLRGESDVAVVMVHGWSATPKQMLPIAKAIHAEGHTVSMPLLRGHGNVPEDLESATCEQWLEDVVSATKEARKLQGIEKVIVGGISMGGNLSLLASQKANVDGIVLIGAPVHLKNHFWIWLGSRIVPFFMKYSKKRYPEDVKSTDLKETSYQYFPVVSVRECLEAIRKATFSLKKVTAPILILQTNEDYLVSKYSPWVIYNGVKSKTKKLQWVKTKNSSHVLNDSEMSDSNSMILNFIKEIEKSNS